MWVPHPIVDANGVLITLGVLMNGFLSKKKKMTYSRIRAVKVFIK